MLNQITNISIWIEAIKTHVVQCLSEYLLKEGYANNPVCPCNFIKKLETEFAIIIVYVDDLNLIGTPEELTRTAKYLKKEFEMKDLGKTKFCLNLQIEHFPTGVLVHQ